MSFILILLLCQSNLSSQNKADYQWILGLDQDTMPGIQSYMFDFNDDPFKVKVRHEGLEFDSNNASICDKDGNLLLYSNGCAIANGEHEVMPNGSDINEGNYFDNWWGGDCGNGYPGRQDIIILPSPSNQNEFYVVHKPVTYIPSMDPSKFIDEIRFSKVNLTLDDGKGDVTEKNTVFYKGERLLWSYLDAVQHENQQDWWIVQPAYEGNSYYTFLLDSTGINLSHIQNIGPSLSNSKVSASGTSKFDPTGNRYGIFNAYTGLFLFDFDRATGMFSETQVLEVESNPDVNAIFSSIEWSANGRFIYLAVHDRLYQLDSYEENLENGLILVDYWNEFVDPFPTTFNMMARGPDCKIYICSNSSVMSYSVIKNPNEQGTNCNLIQQGIELPYRSTVSSLPNFPNFRIDEDEVCDSSISSIFGHPIEVVEKKIDIYPNPTKGIITLKIPLGVNAFNWEIRSYDNKLIRSGDSEQLSNMELDCSHFDSGIYFLVLTDLKTKKTYRSRFIKI